MLNLSIVDNKTTCVQVFTHYGPSLRIQKPIHGLDSALHTLFTGSHYNTWRRIVRLSLFRSLLTDKPPTPGTVSHSTILSPPPPPSFIFFCSCPSFLDEPREETLATQARVYVPYFFRTVVWVQLKWKCCEKRPTVCRPYLRRLGSLTVYRCRDKCSTLFSINRRPWILVRPGPRDPPLNRPPLPQLNWAAHAQNTIPRPVAAIDSSFTLILAQIFKGREVNFHSTFCIHFVRIFHIKWR